MTLRKWILMSVLLGVLAGCGGPWSSGDRVLVSKCAFDNGYTHPNRYDVVVFKFPDNPVKNGTPTNYIKRLLGLPGELIAIFFGRLYRWVPEGDEPPFDDREREENGKKVPVDPHGLRLKQYMHVDDKRSKEWFEQGKFEILRKPPQVMLALRRNVYDNDYQAKDLKGKLDRWSPAPKSHWKNDSDTGFTYDGQSDGVDWLRYQHLLRPEGNVIHGGIRKEVKPQLITNSMDYNSLNDFEELYHWVGDLMLECNVEVVEPKGEFLLEVSKGINRYQARWELSTGKCTLFRIDKDGAKHELASQITAVKSAGSYMLRLANFDARLTVWVDRELPFGDGEKYDPPEVRSATKDVKLSKEEIEARRGPTVQNDLERPASLGAKDARVKVSHVRIWRDTYYITRIRDQDDHRNDSDYIHRDDMPRTAWAEPTKWEPIRKQRFTTMYVQPGHFLCLGDNSQASSDGRDWGLVPQRLMLGRALAVYFPLERMGPIR